MTADLTWTYIPNSTIGVGNWWPAATGATTGWQCPGCGHCYSPSVAACLTCPQQPVTSTVTSQLPPTALVCVSCGYKATPRTGYTEVAWQPLSQSWACTDTVACSGRLRDAMTRPPDGSD